MPTYQYACTTCDHRFEEVQSFSDASLTDCPACSGTLRKVFSAVGIVFKGSGFYRTDSRAGVGSTVAKAESSGSDGSSGSEKSTEKSTEKSAEKSAGTKEKASKEKATSSSDPGSSRSGSKSAPAAVAS